MFLDAGRLLRKRAAQSSSPRVALGQSTLRCGSAELGPWLVLSVHLPTYIYLSPYLPTWLPAYLPTYLPTYLLNSCLSGSLSVDRLIDLSIHWCID